MAPTFSSVFRGPHDYAHTILTKVDPADICLFCRDTYAESSCRPMRISHCGHVVGFECFRTWIQRQPDTCPYYSHKLPSSRASRILDRVVSSAWFQIIEDMTHDFFYPIEGPYQLYHEQRRKALQAFAAGDLTFRDAKIILRLYAFGDGVANVILVFFLTVLAFVGYVLFGLLAAVWWNNAGIGSSLVALQWSFPFVLGKIFLYVFAFGVLHWTAFMGVVVPALGLGLQQRWKTTRSLQAEKSH